MQPRPLQQAPMCKCKTLPKLAGIIQDTALAFTYNKIENKFINCRLENCVSYSEVQMFLQGISIFLQE